MVMFLFLGSAYLRGFVLPLHTLALETVALPQQFAVYKRRQPRPRLRRLDRLFWVLLRQYGRIAPKRSFWSSEIP